jgi:predicted phosphodiesterase
MPQETSRRRFLALASCASLSLFLPACGRGSGATPGKRTPDGGPDAAGTDAAGTDAGVDAAASAIPLSKGPWVSLTSTTSARLRFETLADRAAKVTLWFDGAAHEKTPTLSAQNLTYKWPTTDFTTSPDLMPDLPGLHVLQDVAIDGLTPGEQYKWQVDLGQGDVRSGTFRSPPADADAVRLGWIADTMRPTSDQVVAPLLAASPDVVVHGGDIQYQTNPLDTWNGFFDSISPLTAVAPLHFTVGNHEFEGQDEIDVMYDRLTRGQGAPGSTLRYSSFRYGPALAVCLDTESSNLQDATSAHRQWLEALISSATAKATIVCMHRPLYTLSQYWWQDTTSREALHALFLANNVRLVMAGHAHCYEHFVVDGVHYVVDGGGGAILYDPNAGASDVEAARPGESNLRVAVSKSYGSCTIDVAPDGSMTVHRRSVGKPDDTFTVPA